MFREKDYIPFMCGLFILGGFVLIPIIWGVFTETDYGEAILPSLLSCGVFAYAHDKKGNFSVGRLLMGMAFVFFLSFRAAMSSSGAGKPMFLAGGILGYIVMSLCGWAGIWIGRLIRGKERVAQEAMDEQNALKEQKSALNAPAGDLPLPAGDLPAALGDAPYDKFIAASYAAWRTGRLEFLSAAFKKEATEKSLKGFSDLYSQYKRDVERAVALRPFEPDEYLVGLTKDNFVLTSRAVYILKGAASVVLLGDIQSYKTSSGFWNTTARITLKSGQELEFPKLAAAPKDEYVNAFRN